MTTDPRAEPMTEDEAWFILRSGLSKAYTAKDIDACLTAARADLRAIAERARQPASPDLLARIETNLRHAERRPDDDFYRGKASAFRVVLSMLDGPVVPTFVCAKPVLDDAFYEREASDAYERARYLANTEEPKP